MKKRKTTKKGVSILNKLLWLIPTILSLSLVPLILFLDALPTQYLMVYITIIIFIIILNAFLLLTKGPKKRNKVGYITSLVFSIGLIFAIVNLNSTFNFFNLFNKDNYKTEVFNILVKEDSHYQKLKDLNNQNIAYLPNNITSINKALKNIQNKITINEEKYDDYIKMFKDIVDNTINSILIEESSYNIFIEENPDYQNQVRILDTIKITTLVKNSKSNKNITKDTFTVYISGIDTEGEISSVGRSDVNMLITVNPKTHQILLTSIPRDYYVTLNKIGSKDKLTHSGLYGIDVSIGAIEDLLNINVDYYYHVNFNTLEKLINALDGVDVYSQYSFVSFIGNYKFQTGYNHMNGAQALGFARERKALPEGDISRAQNQQAVIDGIIRKFTSKTIITKYTNVLNSLNNTFQTNMKDSDVKAFIKMQLNTNAKWNITSSVLKGTDSSEYTYSYKGGKLYVMLPDKDSVNSANQLITSVYEGKILEQSYDDKATNIQNPTQVTNQKPITNNNNNNSPTNDNSTNQESPIENKDPNNNKNTNTSTTKDPLDDFLPSDNTTNNNKDNSNDNTNTNNTTIDKEKPKEDEQNNKEQKDDKEETTTKDNNTTIDLTTDKEED